MSGWIKTAEGKEPRDQRMKEIVFQIRANRPAKDIAQQFRISLPRISRIRRKLELPDKRRREPE